MAGVIIFLVIILLLILVIAGICIGIYNNLVTT
jgi:hypothetical protein